MVCESIRPREASARTDIASGGIEVWPPVRHSSFPIHVKHEPASGHSRRHDRHYPTSRASLLEHGSTDSDPSWSSATNHRTRLLRRSFTSRALPADASGIDSSRLAKLMSRLPDAVDGAVAGG